MLHCYKELHNIIIGALICVPARMSDIIIHHTFSNGKLIWHNQGGLPEQLKLLVNLEEQEVRKVKIECIMGRLRAEAWRRK